MQRLSVLAGLFFGVGPAWCVVVHHGTQQHGAVGMVPWHGAERGTSELSLGTTLFPRARAGRTASFPSSNGYNPLSQHATLTTGAHSPMYSWKTHGPRTNSSFVAETLTSIASVKGIPTWPARRTASRPAGLERHMPISVMPYLYGDVITVLAPLLDRPCQNVRPT